MNDSERASATSLHIVHYRSLSLTIARNAQRSAAVVETGLYSQATVFEWKTGLNPLNVDEVRIGDVLNRTSQ